MVGNGGNGRTEVRGFPESLYSARLRSTVKQILSDQCSRRKSGALYTLFGTLWYDSLLNSCVPVTDLALEWKKK